MKKTGRKLEKSSFDVFPKVLTTMLLIFLLPLASLWYVNTRLSQRDINQTIATNLKQTTDALVLQTDNWVNINLRVLSYFAQLEAIRSMKQESQNLILIAMINPCLKKLYLSG